MRALTRPSFASFLIEQMPFRLRGQQRSRSRSEFFNGIDRQPPSNKPARPDAAELVVRAQTGIVRRMDWSPRGGWAIESQQFHRRLAGGRACGLASSVRQDRYRNVAFR